MDLSGDGGVLKVKTLTASSSGLRPQIGDVATVHYTGTLPSGVQFDSSRDRGAPYKFSVGKWSVINGWEHAIRSMNVGERSVFKIKAKYAYDCKEFKGRLREEDVLKFDMELISTEAVASTGRMVKMAGMMMAAWIVYLCLSYWRDELNYGSIW